MKSSHGKGREYKQKIYVCTFALWAPQFASYRLFSKEICWSSRKSVILRLQLNKNIGFTMLQRRMNNWNTVSDRGIKCLERLSCVHTLGIRAFYTFGDIFRRTSDKPSGIWWCWYPAETINENRRRVLTKLFDGFCFRSLIYNKRCASAYSGQWLDLHSACSLFDACGDVRTMCSSPSIPSTGWIVTYY